MGMSLGILCTMGGISFGGIIIERVLGGMGKVEDANMVGLVSKGMLATTAITCVIGVFKQVRNLV